MSGVSVFSCPECGRVLTFKSSHTNHISCECGLVSHLREDNKLYQTLFRKPAGEIYSTLQPGTTGKTEAGKFTVLGLTRVWIPDGIIHYWTIQMEDGSLQWLEESAGQFNVLKHEVLTSPPTPNELRAASVHEQFQVEHNLRVYLNQRIIWQKAEIYGEVFLPQSTAEIRTSVLSSLSGVTLQIFTFLAGSVYATRSVGVEKSDLNLENTRSFPEPVNQNCPECNAEWKLLNPLETINILCYSCGKTFERQLSGEFRKSNSHAVLPSRNPVGAAGEIDGVNFECVAYAQKAELSDPRSTWWEYTLYSSEAGYAWLTEYAGNWIFARPMPSEPCLPKLTFTSFEYEGRTFDKFSYYESRVIEAVGAFPYNLNSVSDYTNHEYIDPPNGWFAEKSAHSGITWVKGRHIDNADVAKVLGDDIAGSSQELGMLTPAANTTIPAIFGSALIGILFLIAVHLISSSFQKSSPILMPLKMELRADSSRTFISNPFKLDKAWGNIGLLVESNIDNTWAEAEMKLTNLDNGEEYSVSNEVEYYHGYTEGENWTEGSRDGWKYITHVPAGNYELEIYGATGAWRSEALVSVIYNVKMDKNLVICILLSLIWPFISFVRNRHLTRQRWENSNFTPEFLKKLES